MRHLISRTFRSSPARITIAILLAIVTALSLAACNSSAPASSASPASKASGSPSSSASASAKPSASAPAKPKDTVKIRIGDRPFLSQLPYHLAADEGFFKEEGIDVTFTMFATGAQNTAAAVAGEVDVLASNEESVLNLVARGADIKAVLTTSIVSKDGQSQAIFVRKALYDSGQVRKAADLKGRSISWIAGWSLLPFALQKSVEAAGVNAAKEMELQVIRENPAKIAALESGAIDSAMFTEPWVTITKSKGVAVPILYINQPEGLPLANIAFKGPYLKDNRDAVLRFLRAYIKGNDLYLKIQADPALKRKYAEKYAKGYGLEVQDMANMQWSDMSKDGSFNRAAAEEWLGWVAENGGVQKKVSYTDWYDPSFVEELKKEGVLK